MLCTTRLDLAPGRLTSITPPGEERRWQKGTHSNGCGPVTRASTMASLSMGLVFPAASSMWLMLNAYKILDISMKSVLIATLYPGQTRLPTPKVMCGLFVVSGLIPKPSCSVSSARWRLGSKSRGFGHLSEELLIVQISIAAIIVSASSLGSYTESKMVVGPSYAVDKLRPLWTVCNPCKSRLSREHVAWAGLSKPPVTL